MNPVWLSHYPPACRRKSMSDATPSPTISSSTWAKLSSTLKRSPVNFAVKHVKSMVPRWQLPGAIAFRAALKVGAGGTARAVPLGPDDIACLQYTGDTTGLAKGAILTHGNLVAKGDRAVFALTDGLVGCHTLKHLVAALAAGLVAHHLRRRRAA